MKKVLSIVFCALLLTSSVLANVSCSCDKSAPEFEGAPVSITGSFRWEDGRVYLDVIVTNNTNKGIMNISTNGKSFRIAGDATEYQTASSFSPAFGKLSPNWLDKPAIGANGNSQIFSEFVGSSGDDSGAGIVYFTAYKCVFTITQIEFDGYGTMTFESNPMEFTFEGHMNSYP